MPNEPNLRNLLQGPAGPVFQHVRGYMAEAQRFAKLDAPKNTGSLAANTRAEGPSAAGIGLEGTIRASAINPRTGKDYSLAVHQGHGDIIPVTYPALRFFWKGRWVETQHVRPRRGRPFLWNGLQSANVALRTGKFRLTVNRPWRKNGS